jgi:drug/metabolite transporter (DMT)-like permease
MDPHKHLKFKTFAMISIMIIAGPLGNVMLGKGMHGVDTGSIRSLADLARLFVHVFTTPAIWLGIGSLLTFFVANLLVLSWADYSFVQPASAMAYGVVAFFSMLLLGETVTPLRWLGIVVICFGVFIVSRSHPRTTERH